MISGKVISNTIPPIHPKIGRRVCRKTTDGEEDMFLEFRMIVLSNDRQGSYDEL